MPPANQAFRGASLYSGIFDTPAEQDSPSKSQDASTSQSPGANDATRQASNSSSKSESRPVCDVAGAKNTGWSAALRFAPRRTATNTKAKARPNAAFITSFATPATTDLEAPKGSTSRAPGVAPKATIVAAASETLSSLPADLAKQSEAESEPAVDTSDLHLAALSLPQATANNDADLIHQLSKYPITEPPRFTLPQEELERDKAHIRESLAARGQLRHTSHDYDDELYNGEEVDDEDEDVNGFMTTSTGRKAAASKRRNKRKRGEQPSGPSLNGEYDPRVPNDYIAYKQQVYERRKAEVDYQRWKQQEEEEYADEECWPEEKEEEHVRRYDRHPPPPSLHGPSAEAGRKSEEVAPTRALTGEEAYARRVAMSLIPTAGSMSGEKAFQRRQAMSGEEAYARRVAMSQQSDQTSFRGGQEFNANSVGPPGPPPSAPRNVSLGAPPVAPPGPPPSTPHTQARGQSSMLTSQSNSDLASRTNAAAAIAAKLAKLNSATVPTDSCPAAAASGWNEPKCMDPSTFAQRLMASQGYVEGQGLGAAHNRGIATPIVATTSMTKRGTGSIFNPALASQARVEAERFGSDTASRIIVLINMATAKDLEGERERDELVQEVAEECAKFGIVQRVLPHMVTQQPSDADADADEGEVRVFVEFSGQAGSWKAVRALDGRYFEGKIVKAFYYDEKLFQNANYDSPLSSRVTPSSSFQPASS
ncbi:related to conserved hypothetcial protein [Melanopsichium pennsylvanicum]|uniref:Related to conserved hypothetcial protein n=2 Tax=Melanopsichium pennsylvanicum TaxID=63383 RepID=A0AAJ4XRN4_9BASI|nr:conserved hypothetcial protein [Melanopsichium pennsylvanicum 4]SNX87048.1 related to conserved hypothetcial protein [Melanopsichium pennsylvanicum]